MPATALKPRHEEMLRLRESGHSAAQIAKELGVAENSVFVALSRLRKQGVEVPASNAPVLPRGPSLEVPTWVPPEFRAGYRKVAAERGEEDAASWARRMKNGEPAPIELTSREKQLLDLRTAGHSLSVMAGKAEVTPSAVKKTLQRLRGRGVEIPAPAAAVWDWTDELVEKVRTLHGQGRSAGQIADEIGAPTRNTVIGKIARLGLKRADAPKPKAAVVQKAAAPGVPVAKVASKPALLKPAPPPPPKPIEAKPATTAAEGAPADAITIHELRDHRCHWPFGDPRDDDFRYCGAPVAAATRERGRFYCDGHLAAASVPAKGRGR